MSELEAASQWLYGTLTSNQGVAALVGNRVYRAVAPQGAQLPCVVFHHAGGTVRNSVGASARVWSRPQFVVRGVDAGEAFPDAVARAVDAALIGASGTVAVGGRTYAVFVAGLVEHVELEAVVNGVRYNQVGGRYQLFVEGL